MAQQTWRLALENAGFPLLSGLAGSGVAIQNQDVQLQKPSDLPKYRPKLIFCSNVLPITEGLKSIAFTEKIAAATVGPGGFDEAWNVIDSSNNYGIFSPAARANYYARSTTLTWVTNPLAGTNVSASHAIVGGQSYICYALDDVYTINCATGVLTTAGLTGITPSADIKGITSANNYLIAWNDVTIFWSSPINPTDFAPSLTTGAGSGIPSELRGTIVACYPALNGFFIYTTTGIMLAQYSGNAQYPWIYKSIAGSQAIRSSENVTHSSVDIHNFAVTDAGLMRFTVQGVEVIAPEIGEFLSMRMLETYNTTTGAFASSPNVQLKTQITRIGARYLILSFGNNNVAGFTAALAYDMALQRWGRFDIAHVYCFAWPSTLATNVLNQIAFISSTGVVTAVSLGQAVTGAAGIVVIGNISLTRGTMLTLQEVLFESGQQTPLLFNHGSLDGKTLQARVAITADSTGLYHCRQTAQEHNLVFQGDFALSNLEVVTTQAGAR